MDEGDSFFTPGLAEAAGLLVVTARLALGVLALARRLCRGRPGRRVAAGGQGVLGWVLVVGAVRRFRWL